MQTFLEKSAKYIFEKYENPQQLENVCVILPTRRAVYFFKRALALCADRPFLAPEVVAIDDWVSERCGLQIADSVSLLFEFYDVYKTIDPNINFEKYLGWASVLLQDLDRIDQYMVDAPYLFDYMTEARALERWHVEWPNSNATADSTTVKKYFELFNNLNQAYTAFRQHLLSKSQAYRGMAYRHLAEHTFELLLDASQYAPLYHFFVGFNALSSSESTVFKALIKAKKGETLWDTDYYYMRDNGNVEGGKLLRKYKEEGWTREWNWVENHLSQTPREIHAYGVPNASMQTKLAGHLYGQWLADGDGGSDEKPTAIILADENLLVPMLYSLDETVTDLNVTMGLSLRNSLLFTLIDSLFELQFTVGEFRTKDGRNVKIPKFNHRTVEKVLNHPFIRRYEFLALQNKDTNTPTIIQETIRHIQQNNIVYLEPAILFELGKNHPLFVALFSRWSDNPKSIIHAFYGLIDLLREVYKETQNAVETEYLYLFYTLLKQLETTLANEHIEKLNMRSFRAFLYELIRQTKIPFSGEPISALQILGMLETRTLDFERIIIISMNEGLLPSSKRQNSLVPWDIAREVGLPIYTDQDAVMSYHFYRLLQRASDVHLIYTTDPNTYNGGESSRFLLQIEHELTDPRFTKTKLIKHNISFKDTDGQVVEKQDDSWTIPKNDDTLQFIINQLTQKGLYATQMSQYLKCSLQYYFARVAGVTEDEEVEDKLGASEFGSWVHSALEQIDIQYFMQNKSISDDEIDEILRAEFVKLFGSFDPDAGQNRLLYQVARQITIDFIHEQQLLPLPITVLATERKLETTLNIERNGELLPIKIAGKIDRIELVENTLRVVDYKTGKIENLKLSKNDTIEKVLNESSDFTDEKIRQLWLYKYLIYKQMLSENGLKIGDNIYEANDFDVTSGFYSLRNIGVGFIENPIKFSEADNAQIFVEESEKHLRQFITEKLLNPEIPFERTADVGICEYCDYRGICRR